MHLGEGYKWLMRCAKPEGRVIKAHSDRELWVGDRKMELFRAIQKRLVIGVALPSSKIMGSIPTAPFRWLWALIRRPPGFSASH